jgi:hypothetical protein
MPKPDESSSKVTDDLLAYETLGGRRGRVEATGRYAPLAALREDRTPRRALALGLVAFVGLGGYAWHRVNNRPLPATEARFRLTAAPGASSSAPSAAGSVTPEWDTASPVAIRDPQLVPRSKEEDSFTVVQPFPSPVQTDPPTPIGSSTTAPSAALAEADLALPLPAPSVTLGARVRWRRIDRPRPPARPSFWEWLFGHKETNKAKPGKPR